MTVRSSHKVHFIVGNFSSLCHHNKKLCIIRNLCFILYGVRNDPNITKIVIEIDGWQAMAGKLESVTGVKALINLLFRTITRTFFILLS
jgi:hypothetical protein